MIVVIELLALVVVLATLVWHMRTTQADLRRRIEDDWEEAKR